MDISEGERHRTEGKHHAVLDAGLHGLPIITVINRVTPATEPTAAMDHMCLNGPSDACVKII